MQEQEGSQKKFDIKKIIIKANWTWDIELDICVICRNHLIDPCIECEANDTDNEKCMLVWGVCDHAFHYHCFNR